MSGRRSSRKEFMVQCRDNVKRPTIVSVQRTMRKSFNVACTSSDFTATTSSPPPPTPPPPPPLSPPSPLPPHYRLHFTEE
ncbi:hypothetical protein RhiirA5_418152 [Rhizophagus irregularis]|uniref:Uncharacterized protein n=1 Tax=Rhizophagus irregularis TaxID=588596 RepID=A0A2I1E882_9GLOM|nr:hypothetical protein RhiirA5_418152 [Rhizophagus irregularis]PKY18327.1 hypothetical protein RhiirB3_431114 [Rhizophagus irregularis]CAB5384824.1 unnamed protein product [Rhizophagus irregularis]